MFGLSVDNKFRQLPFLKPVVFAIAGTYLLRGIGELIFDLKKQQAIQFLEMAYSFQNRKIEQLVTLTAKQRYDTILKENPILIQRLSNRVLASYLDIREETLSRLKSR